MHINCSISYRPFVQFKNMVSLGTRLPKLCLSRSMARVRVHSPTVRAKPTSNSTKSEQNVKFLGNGLGSSGGDHGYGNGNKVMVVVNLSLVAKGAALALALSHAVQNEDTLVVLYISKQSVRGPEFNLKVKAYEFLYNMKRMCQRRRPGVKVEIAIRKGNEKGPTIVEEAKKQRVSLLVLGQRKRSTMWKLVNRWKGKKGCGGAEEYCIQNASRMTIAVRSKGKKLGGYLIHTKRHKNFRVLAQHVYWGKR